MTGKRKRKTVTPVVGAMLAGAMLSGMSLFKQRCACFDEGYEAGKESMRAEMIAWLERERHA